MACGELPGGGDLGDGYPPHLDLGGAFAYTATLMYGHGSDGVLTLGRLIGLMNSRGRRASLMTGAPLAGGVS